MLPSYYINGGALVNSVVTSPPYYQQRDPGAFAGQLGWEDTPGLYVDALVARFSAFRPLLHPTASVWVNIGDTTDAAGWLGIPWMFARAMRDAGYIVRAEIVWHKPNAMPSGAAARRAPSPCHELVFMFSAGPEPVYDFLAGAEPGTTTPLRLPRSVWTIPLDSYRGNHFAAFPLELARRCIRLGSTETVCRECSAPVVRAVASSRRPTRPGSSTKTAGLRAEKTGRRDPRRHVTEYQTTGWSRTCKCEDRIRPAVILDPFAGHGTTALAALEESRAFVMSDIDPENCRAMRDRLGKAFPGVVIHSSGFGGKS